MVARKPLDQLTPAYRRRIERAQAAGKTRQEARGHGVPVAHGGAHSEYTERRNRRLNALLAKAGGPSGPDDQIDIRDMILTFGVTGTMQFLQHKINAHREYDQNPQGNSIQYTHAYHQMQNMAQAAREKGYDVPHLWLFYH